MSLRKRSHVVLLVMFHMLMLVFALPGCKEGTQNSPVSALFLSEDFNSNNSSEKAVLKTGSIVGTVAASPKIATGSIAIVLYEWIEGTKKDKSVGYELGREVIATTTSELPYPRSFKFSSLTPGKYSLYIGKAGKDVKTTFEATGEEGLKVFKIESPDYLFSIRNIEIKNDQELNIHAAF